MKKLLIIILIIIAGVGIWYVINRNSDSDTNNPQPVSTTSRPDASNATFIFDDESITLKKGLHEQEIAPNSALTQETTLTDIIDYGDINGDKKDDAVVVLKQTSGGSGVFIYLAAYVSGPVNYKGTNAVFIGDRIEPESVSTKNGLVTLNYLNRKPNEAFSSKPTVSVTQQFIYKNGELVKR
ncbi:MAG: hypothetical protein ACYC1K_00840 [Minisyncoccota bacterium]